MRLVSGGPLRLSWRLISIAAEVHIHMRLRDKVAIVVGAGQSPGEGMGNGRATVMRFVQEGAKVLAVDNNLASAEETVAMARQPGGECVAFEADVTKEATLAAMTDAAQQRWGRIDVLHYNVGACNLASHRVTYCGQNPLRRNDFEHTLRHTAAHRVTWRNTSRRNPAITQGARK
jgi:NAD(P)-dependent dehydrogenase (short-subunit alcohol dehydrogenase family)